MPSRRLHSRHAGQTRCAHHSVKSSRRYLSQRSQLVPRVWVASVPLQHTADSVPSPYAFLCAVVVIRGHCGLSGALCRASCSVLRMFREEVDHNCQTDRVWQLRSTHELLWVLLCVSHASRVPWMCIPLDCVRSVERFSPVFESRRKRSIIAVRPSGFGCSDRPPSIAKQLPREGPASHDLPHRYAYRYLKRIEAPARAFSPAGT